jgi:hypothetical protein
MASLSKPQNHAIVHLTCMKAILFFVSFIVVSSLTKAQNTPPQITTPEKHTVSYGQQACFNITTTDADNDTVIIWWGNNIWATFSSTNNINRFSNASVCITASRGKHNVGDNVFELFATDGKDTVSKLCRFDVRDYPYKVHPVVFNKFNSFMIDVMGDASEPWGNYIGLTYESKIYDLNMVLYYTDTNRFFSFTPTIAGKYLLFTTYKTSTPNTYTSKDTLETDLGVGVVKIESYSLSIYPTPASNIIHFQNLPADVAMFEITDMTGRVITTITAHQSTVDVSHLKNGVYIITAYNAAKTLTLRAKLIKE